MIAPAVKLTADWNALGEVFARAMGQINAQAGVTVDINAGGARGASKNALIAAVQADAGRNPFYVTAEERLELRGMIYRVLRGRGFNWRQVGEVMLRNIKRHVADQVNHGRRAFTPLTPAYAAYKRRKFGFVTPILKATGDLLGGLRVSIRRAAGRR